MSEIEDKGRGEIILKIKGAADKKMVTYARNDKTAIDDERC